MDLLLACLGFPAAVCESAQQMQPGVLAEYAFALVQSFSRFYADCPVLAAPEVNALAFPYTLPSVRGLRLAFLMCQLGPFFGPDRLSPNSSMWLVRERTGQGGKRAMADGVKFGGNQGGPGLPAATQSTSRMTKPRKPRSNGSWP
jgi:hypothetical protein